MSTVQEAVLCDPEGNRRSGVALVIRHRLYGLSGLKKGDEHPA